jgi:hypothetical protein
MKSQYLLLTLIASAGLIAADAPAPDAPGGQGAPTKTDGGPAGGPKGEKKGGKSKPLPEGVTEADMKKLQDARKATSSDPSVMAAQTAYDNAKKADGSASTDETKKALTEAKGALAEAQKSAVIKADPSLTDLSNKVAEADKKAGGKKGKSREAGSAKPAKQ